MKKLTLYLLFMIMLFTMLGCNKKNTNDNNNAIQDFDEDNLQPSSSPALTDTPAVTAAATLAPENTDHTGQMRSYLSGLWVPIESGIKRPYAFQFSNFKTVRNQSGIGQADIVYECLVEGGITRLLGISQNYSGDRLGSVRSSRHYFVSIADEYDAIYIHYGKTKYATAKIKELGIDNLDGETGIGTTVFYRDKSLKAPHNAFASLEGILEGIKKKGYETDYAAGYEAHYKFYESDTDLTSESGVNKLTLKTFNYNKPYFEYNTTDKLYYRFQFGDQHKDALTGTQLSFKNIIIQFVKEWDIDKNDYQTMDLEDANGNGYYITNGKMVPITWKKKEASRWMRYYNEAGDELTINPGKTFIALYPKDRTKDLLIEK